MSAPIIQWHIPIMGHSQTHERQTGIGKLWLKMRMESAPATCVMAPLTWDSNWKAVANFVRMQSVHEPDVRIYAYSWGCGWGFQKLSKWLNKYGIDVTHAVLCDPVYRSPYFPTWLKLNPLSMMRGPRIKIEHNVRRVSWFRQMQNRPRGHDLVAVNKELTVIEEPQVLELPHAEMEDSLAFHNKVLETMPLSI